MKILYLGDLIVRFYNGCHKVVIGSFVVRLR